MHPRISKRWFVRPLVRPPAGWSEMRVFLNSETEKFSEANDASLSDFFIFNFSCFYSPYPSSFLLVPPSPSSILPPCTSFLYPPPCFLLVPPSSSLLLPRSASSKLFRIGESPFFINFDESITDGPTNRLTDRPTDKASHRDADASKKDASISCPNLFHFLFAWTNICCYRQNSLIAGFLCTRQFILSRIFKRPYFIKFGLSITDGPTDGQGLTYRCEDVSSKA